VRPWDVGRLRSLIGWLGSPRRSGDDQWSAGAYHCPACGQELPAARPGGRAMNIAGPMWLPPTPEELLAKCPFDGHPPYNDRAKAMLAAGTLPNTRHDPGVEPEM
jgi:hypothetical protein